MVPGRPVLPQPDGGHERVAQAHPPNRVLRAPTLAHVDVHRLGRAAVPESAGPLLHRSPEIPAVAQANALGHQRRVRERARQRGDLEREAGRGCERIRADLEAPLGEAVQRGPPQRAVEPGLRGQGEQRPHLHPSRPHLTRRCNGLGRPAAAGQPERQPDPRHPLEVRQVTWAEQRLPVLGPRPAGAGRRVVAAGARSLDHETVGPGDLVPREARGEHVRRDDSEEPRPSEVRKPAAGDRLGVDPDGVVRRRAVDGEREPAGLVPREAVQKGRDLRRDARPHEHVVDAPEHRAVEHRRRRHLDLLEEVDADDAVVPLLGEPHLGERGDDGEFHRAGARPHAGLGNGRVRRAGAAVGAEVPSEDRLDHPGDGEVRERAPDVPARVPVLEAVGDDDVERRTRDDAELTRGCDGAGEPPRRDGDPHPALDHDRIWARARGGAVDPTVGLCHALLRNLRWRNLRLGKREAALASEVGPTSVCRRNGPGRGQRG